MEDPLLDTSCRICLQIDKKQNLINPCNCSGTNKYVHRKCINTWRKQFNDINNTHCNVCNSEYKIKTLINLKYYFFIPYLLYIFIIFCVYKTLIENNEHVDNKNNDQNSYSIIRGQIDLAFWISIALINSFVISILEVVKKIHDKLDLELEN